MFKIGVIGCGMIAERGHLPGTNFLYELIGTDGVIRYNREEHSFELRNSHGPHHLPWHPEKSFVGIHAEFAKALKSGRPGNMPTARDGIMASRIAQAATEQAIRDRKQADLPAKTRVADVHAISGETSLDTMDLPMTSASMVKGDAS